jgi:phage-related baseplate assembly protein
MAGAFTAVDLSKLPYPDAVEQFAFEDILAAMIADLQSRDPEFSALVESDPAYKVLEVCAYRETLIRQRTNEAVKAVTLAYAADADLENIAANYNVQRQTIVPANPDAIPPTPAVLESDADLRRRVQLSFEGFTTAGSRGAYVFHSLGANVEVLDADVYGPPETPGVVRVAVLSRIGAGSASSNLLDVVAAKLNAEDVRPLTDFVVVESANIVEYSILAELTFYPGPDSAVVLQAAQAAAEEYVGSNHRLGRDVTLSGLYRALHQEGVQNVILTSPSENVVTTWNQAAWCTSITIVGGGVDE